MTRGQQKLHWKLFRRVAQCKFPKASVATHTAMARLLYDTFEHLHNGGKPCKELSDKAFSEYYMACQKSCIEMFGISGMDEDEGEFDHGGPRVNQ